MPEAQFVALFDPVELDDQFEQQRTDQSDQLADLTDAAGLSTSYDPIKDDATVSQVSTLGFYDPSVDRIAVRGDELTPGVQEVLVHELTHALQHQYFDVQMGGPDDMEKRAVVEADAMRIEDAYVQSLDGTDRDEATVEVSSSPETEAALSDVPWAVVDERQAPYILGPMFLQHVFANGGDKAVDAVFSDVPSSDELIDPLKYDLGATHSDVVRVVKPYGAKLYESLSEWSMYDALVMLDAWLPWRDSRAALDGWVQADRLVYQKDLEGPICFGAGVEFATAEQAEMYRLQVVAWATASGSPTVPTTTGNIVSFEACPRPDGSADPPTPALMTSEALYVEHMVMAQMTDDKPSVGRSWYSCVARALIDQPAFTSVAFTEELTPEQQAAITVAGDTAKWVCGPPPIE
jgi:hypothetical protein